MSRINSQGYIERKVICRPNTQGHGKGVWRNWWLVKWGRCYRGQVQLKTITLPAYYVGKKVVFKIEVIADK